MSEQPQSESVSTASILEQYDRFVIGNYPRTTSSSMNASIRFRFNDEDSFYPSLNRARIGWGAHSMVVDEPAAALWALLRSLMDRLLRPPAGSAYCRICASRG